MYSDHHIPVQELKSERILINFYDSHWFLKSNLKIN